MEFGIGSWRVSVAQKQPDNDELREKYDMVAPFWHSSIQRLGYIRAYKGLFQRLYEDCYLHQLTAESRILDAGIGTGALSESLYGVLPTAPELHGSDISAGMLEEASWRLAQRGYRPVLHQQDSRQTLPQQSYDLIITAHMLEHLPNPAEGVACLVQQLRPAAPIVIVMTRSGIASSWLHLNWSLRTTSATGLINMMSAAGLWDPHLVQLGGPPWCSWMSVAAIAFKPIL